MNDYLQNLSAHKLLEWLREVADDCEHEAHKPSNSEAARAWYAGHKDACERTRFKIRALFFGDKATEETEMPCGSG